MRLNTAAALHRSRVDAGSIPPVLGKLVGLTKLHLHNNNLDGESCCRVSRVVVRLMLCVTWKGPRWARSAARGAITRLRAILGFRSGYRRFAVHGREKRVVGSAAGRRSRGSQVSVRQ